MADKQETPIASGKLEGKSALPSWTFEPRFMAEDYRGIRLLTGACLAVFSADQVCRYGELPFPQ